MKETANTTPLLERLLTCYRQSPRIALLISGTGSNAENILAQAARYPSLQFVAICTDKINSGARRLSECHALDYYCQTGSIKTLTDREQYFQTLARYLESKKVDTLIYAGFMKISPPSFVNAFPGINLHPADLTLLNAAGKPRYTGQHAIRDALLAGESTLAATVHLVDCEMDCGVPLMVSPPLPLTGENRNDVAALHEKLKIHCEYQVLPRLLERLAGGDILPEHLPLS